MIMLVHILGMCLYRHVHVYRCEFSTIWCSVLPKSYNRQAEQWKPQLMYHMSICLPWASWLIHCKSIVVFHCITVYTVYCGHKSTILWVPHALQCPREQWPEVFTCTYSSALINWTLCALCILLLHRKCCSVGLLLREGLVCIHAV